MSASRLTKLAFPAYRHRLGKTPHPVTDPRGHSFGVREEPVISVPPPEQWRDCEAYLYGCDLFNHGYWWEAHEAWESLWKALPRESVQGRFLQALIQVAAACLHVDAGTIDGCRRALERADTNVQPLLDQTRGIGADRYMGLGVLAWWSQVQGLAKDPGKLPGLQINLAADPV